MVGRDALLARGPLRVGLFQLVGLLDVFAEDRVQRRPARDRLRAGRDCAGSATHRLGQLQHRPRDQERRDREDDERRPPRDRRNVTGDSESDPRAEQLAGQHVAPDLAALSADEPIADHRRDDRSGRGGRDAEREPGEQQHAEGARGRTPDHADAPQHDRAAEDRRPAQPVGEHPEREAGDRGNERVDRDQQTDVSVGDVQRIAQRGCRRTDSGGISAGQREDAAEHQDHSGAGRTAEGILDLAAEPARDPVLTARLWMRVGGCRRRRDRHARRTTRVGRLAIEPHRPIVAHAISMHEIKDMKRIRPRPSDVRSDRMVTSGVRGGGPSVAPSDRAAPGAWPRAGVGMNRGELGDVVTQPRLARRLGDHEPAWAGASKTVSE